MESSTQMKQVAESKTTENTEKHGKIAKNRTKMRPMKPEYSIIVRLGIFK